MKNILDNKNIRVHNPKKFKLKDYKTDYKDGLKDEKSIKQELETYKDKIADLQEKLFAENKHAVLVVLQAIDGAGKDSCIKHVLSGVNPQGCEVTSFKQPSREELDHDFIWRTYKRLPERGKIGVFNRSYYEEVLICKVHKELIIEQHIPGIETVKHVDEKFWENRYRAINEMERHLVKSGTVIIKVFLNLGKDEQKNRFLERIENPEKQWKFNYSDLQERKLWNKYQSAYEDMIRATSTKHAPWHIVPADDQWISRAFFGEILLEVLQSLNPSYTAMSVEGKKVLNKAKEELMGED
jgi:PPK2 family polyphosphate:nucleotide phosphotransferase